MPRRQFLQVDPPVSSQATDGPPTVTPKTVASYKVAWQMSGDLTGLRGFNVVLTTAAGNPRNASDVIKSRIVSDMNIREYTFSELQAGSYVAWVQAFVDGSDSVWVSSTGIEIADDLIPTIRTGDDRNAYQFTEDFRSSSLPVGMFVGPGTDYDLTTRPGEIAMEKNDPPGSASGLGWDFLDWAEEYLDNWRGSGQLAQDVCRLCIKLQVDNPAAMPTTGQEFDRMFSLSVSYGGAATDNWFALPIVNDGKYHYYYVPLGKININSLASITIFPPIGFAIGTIFRIDAIALAFGNIDVSLDGNVDRGITARKQFDQDVGGDYFLESSVRQPGDPSGGQIIIEPNGVFYRSADGTLHETSYKQGRRCDIGNVSNLGRNSWESEDFVGIGGAKITPALPTPVATNKVRMIMEPKGAIMHNTGSSPQRLVVEPYNIGTTGWSFSAVMFYGGTLGRYRVDGPWSASNQAKSQLTLNSNHASGTTNSNDAWYYGADEMPVQDTSTYYYRMCCWINVEMPTETKANGRPYAVDLTFYLHYGHATQGGSDITMGSSFETRPHKFRAMTDGRTYLFPIWFHGSAQLVTVSGTPKALTRWDVQNIKVDWTASQPESGAPGGCDPTFVEIDNITWDYVTGATSESLSGMTYNLVFLEEH